MLSNTSRCGPGSRSSPSSCGLCRSTRTLGHFSLGLCRSKALILEKHLTPAPLLLPLSMFPPSIWTCSVSRVFSPGCLISSSAGHKFSCDRYLYGKREKSPVFEWPPTLPHLFLPSLTCIMSSSFCVILIFYSLVGSSIIFLCCIADGKQVEGYILYTCVIFRGCYRLCGQCHFPCYCIPSCDTPGMSILSCVSKSSQNVLLLLMSLEYFKYPWDTLWCCFLVQTKWIYFIRLNIECFSNKTLRLLRYFTKVS